MFSLRPAYVPAIAGRPRPQSRNPRGRVLVGVGADAAAATPAPAAPAAATDTKVDPKDLGLYVGLPAVGAGVVAILAGLSTPLALLVGLVGGTGGYFYLDYKNEEEKANEKKLAEAAAINAKAAVDAKEKERLAKLDVVDVSMQTDAIGMSTKAGLGLFNIGFVPGAGAVLDWKLVSFKAVPTNDVVKQLTDLQKALSDAGYARAASQIADTASSAALLRDSGGTVLTSTTTSPPP